MTNLFGVSHGQMAKVELEEFSEVHSREKPPGI